MAKLFNLARMTTATTGTGTITLGSAVSGYLTFAQAGAANGDIVSYAIKDGTSSEIGTGTYTSSGTTLTRTVTKSTNSNAAISLSGAAEVFITVRAEDFQLGTSTNDSAPAGYIGEYVTATRATGSAISLTNALVSDVISISLTAGDWDVSGNVVLTASGSNLLTSAWVSTTSATAPTLPDISFARLTSPAGGVECIPTGVARISLSTTTTVYLSTQPLFSSGTITGAGVIAARRVR